MSILEANDLATVITLMSNCPHPHLRVLQEEELCIILAFAKRSRHVHWCFLEGRGGDFCLTKFVLLL